MYEMKWLITIFLVIVMSVSSSTLLIAQAEPQSSSGDSIIISSFTKPAISEEALNLNISNHNGAVWINSSLFNCEHKIPNYEKKALSFSSSIDTNKYNIRIEQNKYEYDFSNFVSIVPSDTIKELTEEIICDREPEVKGCKLDFGSVIYDLCDRNLTVSVEKSLDTKLNLTTITTILTVKELIDEDGKITYTTFSFRDPEIIIPDVSVGIDNGTVSTALGVTLDEFDNSSFIGGVDNVVYLSFNDTSDLFQNYGTFTETFSSGIASDPDHIGSGVKFDATDTHKIISSGTTIDDFILGNMTILTKVNFKTLHSNGKITRVDNTFSFGESGGNLRFFVWGSASDGNCFTYPMSNFVGNRTYNLIAMKKDSRGLLYVDGILVDNESCTRGEFDSSANTLAIGAQQGALNEMDGTIYTLGIWNRTFDDAEIIELMTTQRVDSFTGEKITQVFTLSNTTAKQITNITLGNITPVGTNLSVSVRTKNLSSSITDGLLAWYDFDGDDEGASTCTDISGNGFNGIIDTPSIGINLSGGWDGAGYQDDGIDSGDLGCDVTDERFRTITQNFTVHLRFKRVGTQTDEVLFTIGANIIRLRVRSIDRLLIEAIGLSDNTIQVTSATSDVWHNIFGFYNGSFLCLEVDGVTTCDASTGNITAASNLFTLGGTTNDQNPLKGFIDDVLLWNRTLSAEERTGIRNGSLLTNWTSYTTKNFSNPYFLPTNKVNGTHAQVKVYCETNGTDTCILNNITIGYDDFEEEAPSDTTPPAGSDTEINWSSFFSTSAGQWNRTVTDDSNVAYCNVSTNLTAGQTWNNESNLTFDSSPVKAQINFSTPSGWNVGDVFGIQAHCCDDIVPENCGADTEFAYTIVSEDTCSPTTPLTSDHVFDANDNCVISSAFNAGNNNVMCVNIAGTGTLTIATGGKIVNFNNVFIHGGCDLSCRAAECFG